MPTCVKSRCSSFGQTLSLGCHIHNGTYLTLSLTNHNPNPTNPNTMYRGEYGTLNYMFVLWTYSISIMVLMVRDEDQGRQIFRTGTVRYADGLWRMRRHGPVIGEVIKCESAKVRKQTCIKCESLMRNLERFRILYTVILGRSFALSHYPKKRELINADSQDTISSRNGMVTLKMSRPLDL